MDTDNPSIETLQTLLLLSLSFFAHGLSKKAYMTLCKIDLPSQTLTVTVVDYYESQFYYCCNRFRLAQRDTIKS